MSKKDEFRKRLDARFSELGFDPWEDCPESSYDRLFLHKGILVTIDLPFQLPMDAKVINDGQSVPAKLFGKNRKIAFVFFQSRGLNKWLKQHTSP